MNTEASGDIFEDLVTVMEQDKNKRLADDTYIAYKLESVARAAAILGIQDLDETLKLHLRKFIELTQKECRERKILSGQDSRDFNETDDFLRNTYIVSGDQRSTVLALIKGKEYSEATPTAVAPMGENVIRFFHHNLVGILDD